MKRGRKTKAERTKRVIQLIAREGVLSELLEENQFRTPNHRRVIELAKQETVEELNRLGVFAEETP